MTSESEKSSLQTGQFNIQCGTGYCGHLSHIVPRSADRVYGQFLVECIFREDNWGDEFARPDWNLGGKPAYDP